jgi:branched-subunit amino acid aminotransferase/4-amino-4-deoxychorismate lyase
VVIFEPYIDEKIVSRGVKEYVTMFVDAPKDNVHAKTMNYQQNAVMANRSKEKGGYQGIKALKNNVLLEASSANIAFVFGKEFATPRF